MNKRHGWLLLNLLPTILFAQVNIEALNGESESVEASTIEISLDERREAMQNRATAPGSVVDKIGQAATKAASEALAQSAEDFKKYGLPPQIKVNSNLVDSIKPSYRNEYMDSYELSCRATEVDILIISNWDSFDTHITVNRQTGVANIKEGDFEQSSNNIPELAVDYCSHMIFKYQKR